MIAFIFRRVTGLLLVLFCVITITFFLFRIAPGSAFSRERQPPPWVEAQQLAKYKLTGTPLQQFGSYMADLVRGDMRVSFKYRDRSVAELIAQTLPISAVLGLCAFALATTIGVTLGSLAALRQHSAFDTVSMLLALTLVSIPTFVIGPALVFVFALKLGVLPVGGWGSPKFIVLPALTLAGPYIAYIARLMRSSMLETLGHDFIRTARAKGLSTPAVVARHAMKVAILPVVSYLGPLAANLLTGSIIVETIFNIPGIGSFFVNSILTRDTFLGIGVVTVYCALLVVLNLVVDIAYTHLDRRIQLYE